MPYFNEALIEKKVLPHCSELARIVKQAHTDFLKIPQMDGLDYKGTTYAGIMLTKIKDLLERSYLVKDGIAKIIPFYSVYRIEIAGFPISFNKLQLNKRKSKRVILPYQEVHQLSLFSQVGDNLEYKVCLKAPLTVGYIVENVQIKEIYLTHQIDNNVHWSKEINNIGNELFVLNNQMPKLPNKKRRVHSKNWGISNIDNMSG